MKRRRASLYTALIAAVMTTLVLMSFAVVQYVPLSGQGALLTRTPRLTTDTWAVFDVESGVVRYGAHIDEARPIASITKLFTAYMVMYTKTEEAEVLVSEEDVATEGTFGHLEAGDRFTFRELLFPLLLESSNDAGAAITRALGEYYTSVLASAIQANALEHTTIVDGTGLSPQNTSTAVDLARFFTHVRSTYPHITDITQLRMYITDDDGYVNNNPARRFSAYRGGKQGYTPEAGKTFVGAFVLPNGKNEVGIVLLGSDDLEADISRILASLR